LSRSRGAVHQPLAWPAAAVVAELLGRTGRGFSLVPVLVKKHLRWSIDDRSAAQRAMMLHPFVEAFAVERNVVLAEESFIVRAYLLFLLLLLSTTTIRGERVPGNRVSTARLNRYFT
jgi:hypothetical protein